MVNPGRKVVIGVAILFVVSCFALISFFPDRKDSGVCIAAYVIMLYLYFHTNINSLLCLIIYRLFFTFAQMIVMSGKVWVNDTPTIL